MNVVRRGLLHVIGAKLSAVITVGSQMSGDGQRQTVALVVKDGWKQCEVALSPSGARRIAAQMTEWADAADKHNLEHRFEWKVMARLSDESPNASDTPPPVAAPT